MPMSLKSASLHADMLRSQSIAAVDVLRVGTAASGGSSFKDVLSSAISEVEGARSSANQSVSTDFFPAKARICIPRFSLRSAPTWNFRCSCRFATKWFPLIRKS